MLVAKVIAAPGADWIDLSATVNYNTTYLSENDYLGAFIGTVTGSSDSIIELSTWSGATLTVEVWLQPLAIGEFNDYYLSDIKISSTTSREIALDGISGTYTVIVETYDEMDPSAVIMVNGEALTRNPNMYGAWTVMLNLSNVSSLVLSTTNPEAISVNLTLREYVTVTTPLPTIEATAAAFNIYEAGYFYYTHTGQNGYYTINYNSNVVGAEFSIIVKANPNDYTGITVQGDTFPIYMQRGTRYYVNVTYMGAPLDISEISPDTANAWFTVTRWDVPTLEVDYLYTYVPVTAAGEQVVEIPMSIVAGVYNLDLDGIPFYVLNNNAYTITAHFGNQAVELDLDYAQIEITDDTFIWFTTNYSKGFAAGVTITPFVPVEYISLGEWTEISIPANESRIYYIEYLEEGYFNITIYNYGAAQIQVDYSHFDYPIIHEGQTFGTFRVLPYYATTVALMFTNYSDYTADFNAIVEPANDVVIEVGVKKSIELASGESKVYYVEDLLEGVYGIAITNGFLIEVTANGAIVTDGRFCTYYARGSVALRFTNNRYDSVVFTVTVTHLSDGVIEVGVEKYIAVSSYNNVKSFFVEGLEEGKAYTITLADYVTGVTVMIGDTTVIEANATTGTFVATGTSVVLTLAYDGADFLYFSVLVSETIPPVDDTIVLGVVENITLSSNSSKTYYIYNLVAGDYRISLSSNLIRVVIGDQTVINYGATKGTFTVTTYSRVALVFYYNGSGTINFNALVTKLDPDLIEIGVAKNITLTADNSAHIYYIEGVTKGLYRVDLTGNVKQVQVIVGNQVIVFYGDNKGYFEYLSKTPADLTVIVSYNGNSTLSFKLTVTQEDDSLLPLGVKRTIEMSKAENVKQYYLEYLSKGQYKITLTLFNGIQIEVLTLNGIIISYGGTEGYFDVQTSIDRLNLIFAYNGSLEVTFTVLVTAVN